MNTSNISQKEVNRLEKEIYEVVVSRLENEGLPYEVQVTIRDDVMTTGVQGDARTYCPLVEITLLKNGRTTYNKEFAHKIGTEVPNKVRGTNRVVVTVPHKTT